MRQTPGVLPGLMLGLALIITGCASTHSQPDASSTIAPLISATDATDAPELQTPAAEPQPSATQALPAPALDLQGQLSVKLQAFGNSPAKGISLGFFFSGSPDAGRLELMTALGSQMGQVGWTPEGAWLKRDGQQGATAGAALSDEGMERYDSIDELSARLLGEVIPLQTLMHWLQGHPAPGHTSAVGPDAGLAEGTFIQEGWLIDTRALPRRLEAVREASQYLRGIRLKVYLDH